MRRRAAEPDTTPTAAAFGVTPGRCHRLVCADVPLEQLTPVIKRTDLGHLRLTQDDLVEIVRLVRKLPGAEVLIESDNNLLSDVAADLPQLGTRVGYIKVRALRPDGTHGMAEVLSVNLAKAHCEIIATDPDLTTEGLISALQAATRGRRRLPSWLAAYFRILGREPYVSPPIAAVIALGALVAGVLGITSIAQRSQRGITGPLILWPASLFTTIAMLVVLGALALGWSRMRTVIFTATAGRAPTFWQQHRAHIGIDVAVAAAFFGLGWILHR